MGRFVKTTRVEAAAEAVFDWHAREGAFERLSPPFEDVRVVSRLGGIRDGGQVALSMAAGPFRLRWLVQHGRFEEGRLFSDSQLEGPFAHWVHEHRFDPDGDEACELTDRIEFALPGGVLGELVGLAAARARLERMFSWRHEITAADLGRRRVEAGRGPLRIAVSGATGLVGSALRAFLPMHAFLHTLLFAGIAFGSPPCTAAPADCSPWALDGHRVGMEGSDVLDGLHRRVAFSGIPCVRRWSPDAAGPVRELWQLPLDPVPPRE